jgi:hypothetical protein
MELQWGGSPARAVLALPRLLVGEMITNWKKSRPLRADPGALSERSKLGVRERAGLAAMGLLLAFGWTAPSFAQAKIKPVVAVTNMVDIAGTGQAAALVTMIRTAVSSTGKFRVIERDFSELDSERALQQAGRVTSNRGGRGGPVAEGVDYVISGSITSSSGGQSSDEGANMARTVGGMFLGHSLGGGNCHKTVSTLAVDIKIVNTKTGEIAFAKQITQHAAGQTSCSGDAGLDMTSLLRDVANQTAAGLTLTMYPVKLMGIQPDGTFVFNYGEGFVTPGSFVTVFGQGMGMVDPDTGVMVTTQGSPLGIVRITAVETRFSSGVPVVPFATVPPNGSIVRISTDDDLARFNPRGHGRHH